MLISIILPNLRGGGAERVNLDLAHEFTRNGHTVDIVAMSADGEFRAEAESSFSVVDLRGDRLRDVPWRLARYLKTRRPDVLIAAMWPLTTCAALARILSGHRCRLILTEHGILSIQYRNSGWFNRLMLRATMAFGYRVADAGIGVSKGVVDDMARLASLSASRLHVVYNPVPPRDQPDAATLASAESLWGAPAGARIVTVGRFKDAKNHPLLLKAFARMDRQRDSRLMLVGTGEGESALHALAQSLGIERQVIFAGFHPDPTPFYQTADLFVLSSDHEGFGNVIVEALACGVPVVATDCPAGPGEILDGGAFGTLVPVRDEAALAEGMARALARDHDQEALRARARDFSPERAAARYLEIIG